MSISWFEQLSIAQYVQLCNRRLDWMGMQWLGDIK